MDTPGDVIAMIFGTSMVFGWIPLLIYFKHKYRIEELRLRSGSLTGNAMEELRALRQEVSRLRDTTTKFDVAFDEALTRLEQRVDRNEQNNTTSATMVSPSPDTFYSAETTPRRSGTPNVAETEPQQVVLGRSQWM